LGSFGAEIQDTKDARRGSLNAAPSNHSRTKKVGTTQGREYREHDEEPFAKKDDGKDILSCQQPPLALALLRDLLPSPFVKSDISATADGWFYSLPETRVAGNEKKKKPPWYYDKAIRLDFEYSHLAFFNSNPYPCIRQHLRPGFSQSVSAFLLR